MYACTAFATVCFMDLGKLNIPMGGLVLGLSQFTAPAAYKNKAQLKMVKINSKISNSLH